MAFRDLKPANIIITSTNALLIDLGSVTPAVISITNRKQALALQDECAELVTACYRAPELFDPPSECMIDERSDVWSLGCCIYAQLMGDSPCKVTRIYSLS